MTKIQIGVSLPTVPESTKITKEDVWGKFDERTHKKLSNGMIVARSEEQCPIFKDKIPYKSVTVVGPASIEMDIVYWLEWVHGANSVSRTKKLPGNKIAIRSNYMCW